MNELVKMNGNGKIVYKGCIYEECSYSEPHCESCAFVSHEDIREIMAKLFKYENTGLNFE